MPLSKTQARARALTARDGIDPDVRAAASLKISQNLTNDPVWASTSQILLYLPIGSEVDTVPLASLAREQGKSVFAPVVDRARKTMTFYRYEEGETLVDGEYGIKTPSPVTSRKADLGRPALIVCPCLAFGDQGQRLGYGGGFYDRFLAGPGRAWKSAALAFAAQRMEELPVEEHDYSVNGIVTEERFLKTR